MVLPKSLLLADYSENDEIVPVVFNSGRDHVDAEPHDNNNRSPSHVATVPPDAALPFLVKCELGRYISTTPTSSSSAGEGVRPR